MDVIEELILRELEKPRTLPLQVGRHLNATYGIGLDEIGGFFQRGLDALEDYEVDLILSPVFTPTLHDQAIFATVLRRTEIAPQAVAGLVSTIAGRPAVAQLAGDDGVAHPVRLREVTVERYIRRLRLEGSIPDDQLRVIDRVAAEADRPTFLAVARRAVWNSAARRELLGAYLQGLDSGRGPGSGAERAEDVLTLLRLAETYEPAGLADFVGRLPGWIEASRRDVTTASSPKPFFNERVEDLHGGGRDQRRGVDVKAAQRSAEFQSMMRLGRVLQPGAGG